MKNKICCVIYTNTKCSDVWEMFINEQLNHFNVPLYFISDKEIPNIDIKTFLYENGEDYYYSWNKSLSHIDYDYFLLRN